MTQQHKDVLDLTKKWVHIADRNLTLAKNIMEDEDILTDSACYNCQQAVEKYLKAFLTFHQIEFPKTHDLEDMLKLCSAKETSFLEFKDDARFLTFFATEIRYPDDWYEPTLEETKKAFAIAEKIKKLVLEKLPMNIAGH